MLYFCAECNHLFGSYLVHSSFILWLKILRTILIWSGSGERKYQGVTCALEEKNTIAYIINPFVYSNKSYVIDVSFWSSKPCRPPKSVVVFLWRCSRSVWLPIDVEKNNFRGKVAVKSLVTKGVLVKTKDTGASGSFKVNREAKKAGT